ncbi:hypothetical protein V6Z12_A10G162600 [Gossypium hirsutum]
MARRCFYCYDSSYHDDNLKVSHSGSEDQHLMQAVTCSTPTTSCVVGDSAWYPDSGATAHLNNDPLSFRVVTHTVVLVK